MKAQLPTNEPERLQELREYAVLDSEREPAFDDLVQLAAHICGTPIATISLVDEDRQWFKSTVGIRATHTARDIAFCAHGILAPDVFVVHDALKDHRFADNPLVTSDPKIRFYAGAPLVTPNGHRVGMLCVNDTVPRDLSAGQIDALRILSRQVMAQLELRRQTTVLRQAIEERARTEESLHQRTDFLQLQQVVAAAANEAKTVEEAMQAVVDLVCAYTGWPIGHVCLRAEDGSEELISANIWHFSDHERFERFREVTDCTRFKPGMGLPGRVMTQRMPVWLRDVEADQTFTRVQIARQVGIKIGFAFPVLINNEVMAVLEFFAETSTAPNERLLEVVAYVGNQVGRVVERKQAEQRTADALHFKQTMLAASPVGIVTYDSTGQCVSANEALARIIGGTLEEVKAQNYRQLDSWKQSGMLAAAEAALATRSEQDLTAHFKTTFGREVWLSCRFSPFHFGGQTHLLLVASDITERKEAEDALQELQRQQRALLDNIPDIAWMKDRESRYIAANEALARAAGWKVEDFVGKSDFDYVPRDLADRYRADDRDVMASRKTKRVVEPFEGKDGKRTWIDTIKTPITDAAGEIIGTVGIARDITDIMHTEEKLRLQGSALQAAANAIVITDPHGRIVWVNPAFTELTGYDPGEVIGKNPRTLKSGRHDEAFYLDLWQTILSGKVWRGELVNKRKDGSLYTEDMTITPVLGTAGEITHFISIKQDVTERKRAEETLRASEQQLLLHNEALTALTKHNALLGENLHRSFQVFTEAAARTLNVKRVSIWLFDEAHTNIRCNDLFEATANRHTNSVELLAKDFPAFFSALATEDTIVANDAHTDPRTREFSKSYLAPRGITSMLDVPLRLHGRVVGVLCCEHVQTARNWSVAEQNFLASLGSLVSLAIEANQKKQTETVLRESKASLEKALEDLKNAEQQVVQQERLRALGTMASGIAHDFNNALAPILGYSELLLYKPGTLDDKERTKHFLEVMNTAARDAASVVRRLREFYRTRDEDEVLIPVDLGRLVEQAVSLTEPRWKDQSLAKGINIFIETDIKNAPVVLGIEADLREMLTNLIFNAVDAMPRGGTIALSAKVDEGKAILSIHDGGTGMTEEVRRRCMEPFFSTKGAAGTGLGLSMVHGIIRRHEGDVTIESQLGKGTTFLISLPLPKSIKAEVKQTKEDTTRPRSLRILLVEDEDLVREVESEYLKADDHAVTAVASGSEALMEFGAGKFDVIITDRAMPVMSGDQLAKTLKKISPNTPVILVTGFGDMMKTAGENLEGVDLILSKPMTMHALREGLRNLTTQHP